ncbi:MAG: hypothetical protein JWN73_1150 [Betaproteobacteria bacterium]|nr:hypothetical protein [Betaproteobacteria bacterium]
MRTAVSNLNGRILGIINCAGQKIWPDEIEAVLKQHPLAADVAVAGLPNRLAGQVAVAFVVLRPAVVLKVSERQLMQFCADRLDLPRVPALIVLVARIPRNQAGKIMRDELVAAHPATGQAALEI